MNVFDEANHLLSTDRLGTANDLTFIYDNVGNVETLTDAGGISSYSYTKINKIEQVADPDPRVASYKYVWNQKVNGFADATGTVAQTYTYEPYGKTIATLPGASLDQPFRWNGEYRATDRSNKIGQRWCDANLGLRTQKDPIATKHPYAYANNDPINNIDPSGTCVVGRFGSGCDNPVHDTLSRGAYIAKRVAAPPSSRAKSSITGIGATIGDAGVGAVSYAAGAEGVSAAAGAAEGLPLIAAGGAIMVYGMYHANQECHESGA